MSVRGGVEPAFMSTSTNRGVAMEYASMGKKNNIMFQIQMGMIDRGASCKAFSQFPGEDEILFPPLTSLEVIDTWFEGNVEVVEIRINANTANLTIDQVRDTP